MNRTTPTASTSTGTNGHVESAAQAVLQAGHDVQEAAVEGARKASDEGEWSAALAALSCAI